MEIDLLMLLVIALILAIIGTAIYQFKKCDDWMDAILTTIGLVGLGFLFFIFYKAVSFIYINGGCS